jgi:mannan endo-1,4-beta-mannosidase
MRIVTPAILALCVVLATGAAASARSAIALGYSHDPAEFQDRDMATVDTIIDWLGTTPATWTLWSNWGSRGEATECSADVGRCAFPGEAAAGLLARGITPMIWWQPSAPPGRERGEYARYIRIINGRHDDYIRAWATDARDHGGPIILRFAHEMNGKWYPWGITRFDNTPERYKKAWQHVWRIFRDVGASNVRFLWSPAREICKGCEPNYRFEDFYPGNRFVDYIGLNAYNSAKYKWRSMTGVLERPIARLREVSQTERFPRGKPIIIDEVGSNHIGGSKAEWLDDGYYDVFRRWPRVKAIVYFDVDMRERSKKDPDWRLIRPTDRSALATYREIAAMPRFRGQIQ